VNDEGYISIFENISTRFIVADAISRPVLSACIQMEGQNMTEKILYRPAEAQIALGIKHSKFWMLVKEGKFDMRKLGKSTFVTAESLRRFADSLAKTS
jgi:hypothetical protein